jgi:hypothetical protein
LRKVELSVVGVASKLVIPMNECSVVSVNDLCHFDDLQLEFEFSTSFQHIISTLRKNKYVNKTTKTIDNHNERKQTIFLFGVRALNLM